MHTERDRVLERLQANRAAIKAFGVRRLGLFGSAARGEASASSDLDFVVEFEKKTFDNDMDLKFFLEEIFGCSVDLVPADPSRPTCALQFSVKPAMRRDSRVYLRDILEAIGKSTHTRRRQLLTRSAWIRKRSTPSSGISRSSVRPRRQPIAPSRPPSADLATDFIVVRCINHSYTGGGGTTLLPRSSNRSAAYLESRD